MFILELDATCQLPCGLPWHEFPLASTVNQPGGRGRHPPPSVVYLARADFAERLASRHSWRSTITAPTITTAARAAQRLIAAPRTVPRSRLPATIQRIIPRPRLARPRPSRRQA